jgi:hypothetical protein
MEAASGITGSEVFQDMVRGALSRIDRGVSVVLALVFLVAGVAGVTIGAMHSHFALLVVSLLVAAWGAAWAAVAWRGRLLGPSQRE